MQSSANLVFFISPNISYRADRRTCLRSSFLRAISAAFSSFVMPTLGEACNGVGAPPSLLGAGDANGVDRGLVDGVSAVIRDGRASCCAGWVCVRAAGLSVSVEDDADVSSVTGMGTGGGVGSSNAPHGSSAGGADSNASI